jgi:hypothetical protein
LALTWLWRVNQRWDLDFCVHVVKGDDIKFDLWEIVTVTAMHDDENPAQGRFQVVEFEERQKRMARIDGATILRYYGLLKQAFAAKPAPLRDP